MGFGVAEGEFLAAAHEVGVSFERTMMLGRQTVNMTAKELAAIAPGLPRGYAEPFLEHLGATEIRSVDLRGFGGATDAQDLNEPIPPSLEEEFSVVIDGGTIEHVFNVPEALRSAMRMARHGGHVIMMTPCNGAPGHGFYQFTPELLFRVFSPENGYEVRRCFLREHRGPWFNVRDPASIGSRCEFRTPRTAYLFLIAERVNLLPVFKNWPAQSDYVTEWAGGSSTPSSRTAALRLLNRMPSRARRSLIHFRARSWPPSYKRRRENFKRADLRLNVTDRERLATRRPEC